MACGVRREQGHEPGQCDDELRELWDEAEFRAERYTALALLERYPQWVTLPLLERLVVDGAW